VNDQFANMDTTFDHLRIELRRPGEIRQAMARCPLVFMPLGTYEYHQEHLPIGLDALTSQGLCLRAAQQLGGLVCPPLFYGTGGDHGEMPFTVMMLSAKEIETLINKTLQVWMASGVRLAVLLSGHFAPEQLDMVKEIEQHWNAQNLPMKVLGLAMNMGQNISMKPDHAGLFETTLLSAFWPETVDLQQLPPVQKGVDVDAGQSPYGPQRLDSAHPLWGIIGADPRTFARSMEQPLLEAMLSWFTQRVGTALNEACCTDFAHHIS
jgi:creatinine amidohydrolase